MVELFSFVVGIPRQGLFPLLAAILIIQGIRRQFTHRTRLVFSKEAGSPSQDITDVQLTAVDADPPDPSTSLSVMWSARAQTKVDLDTDEGDGHTADHNSKFIVLQLIITNVGAEAIELSTNFFRIRSDGIVYDTQPSFHHEFAIADKTLSPQTIESGRIVVQVPNDVQTGQLITNQDEYLDKTVATAFEPLAEFPRKLRD